MDRSWNYVRNAEAGLAAAINGKIHRLILADPNWLPNLRGETTLFVGSDYSGEHATALYQTLSFVIAGLDGVRYAWEDRRLEVRRTFLRDGRRMSFKQLRDNNRWRALIPFLLAAGELPGICVTIALHSSVGSLFQEIGQLDPAMPVLPKLARWPPHVLEKLMRIAHAASVFIAGISQAGQNLLWITDDDAIAPNVSGLTDLTEIFGLVCSQYLAHDLGHLRVGTPSISAGNESGRRRLEDLVAIPDLVAGAMAEMLAAQSGKDELLVMAPPHLELAPDTLGLLLPHAKPFKVLRRSAGGLLSPDANMTSKSAIISKWLADDGRPLKRLVCIVDQVPESENLAYKWLRFHPNGYLSI